MVQGRVHVYVRVTEIAQLWCIYGLFAGDAAAPRRHMPHKHSAAYKVLHQANLKQTMGWGEHKGKLASHAFVKDGGENNSECSCCEKPLDGSFAQDLRVVHARWDNRLKQWIPICMKDHEFGRPPFYYTYGGFETMESAVSWLFAGITLLTLVALFMSPRNQIDSHLYGGTGSDFAEDGWPIAITGGVVLLLVCLCAGSALWCGVGSKRGEHAEHTEHV